MSVKKAEAYAEYFYRNTGLEAYSVRTLQRIVFPMEKPKLVSFKLCPYVQRSVITLIEKDVAFDIEYIDLANKPPWFLEISPMGKVPVLQVGKDVLFESGPICEYLDETHVPRLLHEDPIARAKQRAWIAILMDTFAPVYHLMVEKNEQIARMHGEKLQDIFARVEPYVHGQTFDETFSLVDASIAPIFQRIAWIEDRKDVGILKSLPKVKAWSDVLVNRHSVQSSVVPDIVQLFWEYAGERQAWIAG